MHKTIYSGLPFEHTITYYYIYRLKYNLKTRDAVYNFNNRKRLVRTMICWSIMEFLLKNFEEKKFLVLALSQTYKSKTKF